MTVCYEHCQSKYPSHLPKANWQQLEDYKLLNKIRFIFLKDCYVYAVANVIRRKQESKKKKKRVYFPWNQIIQRAQVITTIMTIFKIQQLIRMCYALYS